VELVRKVRGNLFFVDLPIVMATTESENSQKEAARRAGASDFLTKPMTPESLCQTVRNHLPEKAPGG